MKTRKKVKEKSGDDGDDHEARAPAPSTSPSGDDAALRSEEDVLLIIFFNHSLSISSAS